MHGEWRAKSGSLVFDGYAAHGWMDARYEIMEFGLLILDGFLDEI